MVTFLHIHENIYFIFYSKRNREIEIELINYFCPKIANGFHIRYENLRVSYSAAEIF